MFSGPPGHAIIVHLDTLVTMSSSAGGTVRITISPRSVHFLDACTWSKYCIVHLPFIFSRVLHLQQKVSLSNPPAVVRMEVRFCRHARAAKIWQEIKSLVNIACEDKTLAISLINWINWRLVSPLLLRKTGSETVNKAYIKKALARPLAIFNPKRSGFVITGLVSLLRHCPTPHHRLSPGVKMAAKVKKRSSTHPVCQISP